MIDEFSSPHLAFSLSPSTPPLTPPPKGRGTKLSFKPLIYSTLMKYCSIAKVLAMNKNHLDHIPLPFWAGVWGGVETAMLKTPSAATRMHLVNIKNQQSCNLHSSIKILPIEKSTLPLKSRRVRKSSFFSPHLVFSPSADH